MYIAESVTPLHPDKICDVISDSILDACLEQDKYARVAVETIGGHSVLVLMGEVTTSAQLDFYEVARQTYLDLVGKEIGVLAHIAKQSQEISEKVGGVSSQEQGIGAGDQGIMIGYACNENEAQIPQEIYLARKLLEDFRVDGKSQVVLNDDLSVVNVVLSVQGKSQSELEKKVQQVCGQCEMYCNNIGEFKIGGFDSDSGCTGRKIVVDAYGSRVPVGGGAFSGKDPTKVDRSAAYMARWIAKKTLKQSGANEALVKLGYVIGKPEPLLNQVYIDGKLDRQKQTYDCRPEAIMERFDLRRPIYKDTALNGHFGRTNLPWEKV